MANIKGLPSAVPRVRVSCRLLGHTTVADSTKPKALLRQFVSALCASCLGACPAGGRTKPLDEDLKNNDLYRPLRERYGWMPVPLKRVETHSSHPHFGNREPGRA
ncbi:MAG TPA: hypothetical protein VLO10_05840, partial [Candidatus Deferrimicrobium sp.]|nr:hypothetical protein [Candidatus Deferrimicrobium sp.]